VQIAKDTKLALTKAAKVFILYVTACANDFCKSCNRTTIGVNHVHGAIEELEFKGFNEKLKQFFDEYKQEQTSKKAAKKKTGKEDKEEGGDEDKEEKDEKEEKDDKEDKEEEDNDDE
jgi:TATA-binding protein-associated factor Taf7